MGGFAGHTGNDSHLLNRLATPSRLGQPLRRAHGICTFGTRDIELSESGDDALVMWGYARQGETLFDAATLLSRFQEEGASIVDQLSGEFAVVARVNGVWWAARDPLGTRPLYIADLHGGTTCFATALSPLIHAGADARPDRHALISSLALGYVPAPRTAMAGVWQIRPGELCRLSPRRLHRRYYLPREHPSDGSPLATEARRLRRQLARAVAGALPSAGRVGAFLSGGLDSSLVLALVHATGRPVDAFTLHFGDHLPGELRYAQQVARYLGVRHHILELDARQFCDGIEETLLHLEDAIYEPIAVPNFLLAREAARYVDVLFTGEGGDPLFGGPKNVGLVLTETYGPARHAPRLTDAYLAAHHHLDEDLDTALTEEALAQFDRPGLLRDIIAPHVNRSRRARTFVGRLMLANTVLKGGNNILVKVSKMVGAHDLQLRSPLFDPAVVNLAFRLPPALKLWGTEEKLVLKAAAGRSLPRCVLDRPKRGMGVPLSAWLRGDLGVLAHDVLTERAVRERGLFRWRYVARLLAGERLPTDLARSRTSEKLWMVLVTELQQRAIERLASEAHRV